MKRKTIIVALIAVLYCFNVFGQRSLHGNLEGSWIQRPKSTANTDEIIYTYYSKKYITTIWFYQELKKIRHYTCNYGFYDDCNLPAMDSLKRNGACYFEVTPSDFEYEDNRKVYVENACAQISIFTEKQDTFMNIYYDSRQQYATYKKLDTLPQSIQKYLVEKGIHVGFPHKEIAVDKSIIYAEPDKPTRMYLIKGDIVTVLEEKEGWIKMEYEGKKMITGWIKKKDTKK